MINREKAWLPKKVKDSETRNEIQQALIERKNGEHILPKEKITENKLLKTNKLFEQDPGLAEEIYGWYKNAIERRNREPLEETRFIKHFFGRPDVDTTLSFGNNEQGYLLGFQKHGIFIPTHFAPKTIRGGYELIKELGEGKAVPAVMSVTPDLTDTISKIPSWHVADMSLLSQFRNELAEKEIVYNSHPKVLNLMPALIEEYLEESNARVRENNDYDDESTDNHNEHEDNDFEYDSI